MFVDALRYPLADAEARDGTVGCVVLLLLAGVLLRAAAALWPDWAAVVPLLLAGVPLLGFAGHLGGVLVGSPPAIPTRRTAKLGVRVLAVAAGYLLVPAVAVAAVGYLIGSGAVPPAAAGMVAAILATAALVVAVAFGYLLPAALVTAAENGIRTGFRRESRRGTASGTYFLAWVGSAVLLVLAWSALSATATRGVAAVLAVCWFGYAHVAAAALVARGVERAR